MLFESSCYLPSYLSISPFLPSIRQSLCLRLFTYDNILTDFLITVHSRPRFNISCSLSTLCFQLSLLSLLSNSSIFTHVCVFADSNTFCFPYSLFKTSNYFLILTRICTYLTFSVLFPFSLSSHYLLLATKLTTLTKYVKTTVLSNFYIRHNFPLFIL